MFFLPQRSDFAHERFISSHHILTLFIVSRLVLCWLEGPGAEDDPGRGRGGGVGGDHQARPRGVAWAGQWPRQCCDSEDREQQEALQTLVRASSDYR